ncbi:MAG: alanine racemase [Firmicutes bacterium]|nr:alanine racemase [Candidatus Colimorpha enterica]
MNSIAARTWLEIDREAIVSNHENVRKSLRNGTKIYSVVKGDAYGHGAIEIANLLSGRTDGFCVATAYEALELRNSGIDNDIVVLGGISENEYEDIRNSGIMPSVLSYDEAVRMASPRGVPNLNVWIPVDTGMGRIGFPDNENGLNEIIGICRIEGIKISAVFTHLARADEKDKSNAKEQIERFLSFRQKLIDAGLEGTMFSVSNSAAILELEPKLDIVREGILLYGIYPSDEVKHTVDVKPALSLKTKIEYIKTVPAGTGISYGHTFVAKRETKVATLVCGYADGYPRCLTNKAQVLIRGKRAPLIGNICMDQMMADVTDIEGVKVGDTVTLIGTDGENAITFEEVADAAGTIPYEIMTNLSKPRVPKIYI